MANQDDESQKLLGKADETTNVKVSYVRGAVPCGIIMLLYFVAVYSHVSWLPQYVHQRIQGIYLNSTNNTHYNVSVCSRNESDNNTRLEIRIQQETSEKILYFSYATTLPCLIVNLVMGSYSDSIGRRVFLLVPIFGSFAKIVVTLLVVKLELDLNYFFLAFGLDGIGGSFTTFLLAVFAYTADITPPKNKRTLAIAALEVALAVGMFSGKFSSGLLIAATGFFYPMVLNTGLLVLAFLTVVFLIPETINKTESSGQSPLSHLKNVFGFYFIFDSRRRRCQYCLVMIIFSFALAGRFGRDNTETLYILNQPFCFGPAMIGYFGALRMALSSIGTMLFIKLCLIFLRDEYIIATGMLSEIGGLVLEALATSDLMLWLVPVVSSNEGTSSPMTRSLLSRMTPPSKQGAVFASIATFETVTSFLGYTMYGSIYSATVGTMRGAVFLIMSVWPFLAIIVCIIHVCVAKKETVKTELVVQ